jgi:hypothetical protein
MEKIGIIFNIDDGVYEDMRDLANRNGYDINKIVNHLKQMIHIYPKQHLNMLY